MANAKTLTRSSRSTVKATDLLKRQHREDNGLFKEVEKTASAGEQRRLLNRISEALKAHTEIEEEVFYPAVRDIGTDKAEEMVLESLEEHHVVDLVLAEQDERFPAKMLVLGELLEHHAEEEEEEMFPMVERKFGAERLAELGQRMVRGWRSCGRSRSGGSSSGCSWHRGEIPHARP